MLIYAYLFSLILGGVLLGASLLLGGHDDADVDVDADVDFDADGEADLDAMLDAETDHDVDPGGHGSFGDWWVTFLSLRFWTFFLAFFGLTGLLLDGLNLVASEWIALACAIAMGTTIGGAAVSIIRRLTRSNTSYAVKSKEFVGKSARVIVGASETGSVGKVRVQIAGSSVDFLATSLDKSGFDKGDEVLIVEIDEAENRARVSRVEP